MAVHDAALDAVGQRPHLDLALGCAGSRPWSVCARAQGEPESWHDRRVLVASGVPEHGTVNSQQRRPPRMGRAKVYTLLDISSSR
jgi:hypothetical protein